MPAAPRDPVCFVAAIAAIDTANAADPHSIEVAGAMRPSGHVYGERMSAALAALYPDASEALQLAARAQHLCRWKVPRRDYPEGRAGYHRWRNDLKRLHAQWAADILAANGYDEAMIARTGALIRKEGLATDPETQALEDAACIVFITYELEDFAAKHDDAKLVGILAKTWAKMSARAHEKALTLDLPPRIRRLLAAIV